MLNVLDKANSYDIDACSIRLIYPISFDSSMTDIESYIGKLTINDLIDNKLSFSSQKLSDTVKSNAVWEPNTIEVSNDFHPHIVKMISDKNQTYQTDHTLVKSYQITATASKALNDKNSGGLSLKLSTAAIKRLQIVQDSCTDEGDEDFLVSIPFNLGYISDKNKQGLYLHIYDLNIAVIECHVSPSRDFLENANIAFSAIQEFLYEITHIHRLEKKKEALRVNYSDDDNIEFGFNTIDIIHACLGLPSIINGSNSYNYEITKLFRSLNNSRFFSYTALQFGERDVEIEGLENSDFQRLSHYLAKRYTSHYKESTLNLNEKNHYLPFDNIVYAMSIEGGAVIVNAGQQDNNGESIAHLNNFIRDSLKNVYWPLTLLTYIESLYLLSLNNTFLPRINLQSVNVSQLAELENFRSDILNFRLSYRFSQVSSLENHNTYYDKWRQIFSNEKMIYELSDDITQVNSLLSYHLEKEELKLEKLKTEERRRLELERKEKDQRDMDERERVEKENRKIEKERSLQLSKLGIIATAALSLLGLYGTNFDFYNEFQFMSLETLYGFIFIFIATSIALWIHSKVMKKDRF